MRLFLIAGLAAALAACSPKTEKAPDAAPLPVEETAPPEQAGPLPSLDPTELDLSKIALAMRIPSTFRAYDDGAYLQINLINPRLGVDIAEEFALDAKEGSDSPFLASEAREGFTMWSYATMPEDAERLRALSLEVARLKQEAPGENELTFGAVAPGCWNEPEATPTSLARTLYIRVLPEEDFQVFVPELELTKDAIPGIESFWGACAE